VVAVLSGSVSIAGDHEEWECRYGSPRVFQQRRGVIEETMNSNPNRSENLFVMRLKPSRCRPLIIAHRGDSFHAPENTLEAARLGLEAGADAWEFDVQMTRDGVPVILHDESLLRTSDVAARFAGDPRGRDGFRVSDFDFDDLKALDAGSWFVAENGGPRSARDFGTFDRLGPDEIGRFRSGSVRIPTLEEALIFTREQDWLANIEIKSFPDHPPRLVERALEIIEATSTADRVLISSFDHDDVVAARGPGRRHALGILLATPIHRLPDYAADLVGADTVHVSTEVLGSESVAYRRISESRSLRRDIVAALEERGIPALVYTVNHRAGGALARHLAEIGVAGVFTDDPSGLKMAFGLSHSAEPRA
jgi:glycerophosphoryl diester phosphodiesterase